MHCPPPQQFSLQFHYASFKSYFSREVPKQENGGQVNSEGSSVNKKGVAASLNVGDAAYCSVSVSCVSPC